MGPSEKLVLMDKIFAFPCFSYTILLLLKTENIEVGSKKKQLASIESSQKTVHKLLKPFLIGQILAEL